MTSRLRASNANRKQALCMQVSFILKQLETGDVCWIPDRSPLPLVLGTCVLCLFHPSTFLPPTLPTFHFSLAMLSFFLSFCHHLFVSCLCLFLFIYHTHNIREGMLHRKPCLLSQLRHAQPTRRCRAPSSNMSVDSGPFEWMMRRRGLSKTGEFGTCQM